MRNIMEYPVTGDEAVGALDWAQKEYTRNIENYGVGGIEGLALLLAARFIESHKKEFDQFSRAAMEVVEEVKND